jgi:hypothetical protein
MVKDLHLYRHIIIFKNSFIFLVSCSVFRDIILKITLRDYSVSLITAIKPAVGDTSNKAAKDSHIFWRSTALINPVRSSAIVAICF